MIFVDSNIPMYLVGTEHPNKVRAERLLSAAIERRERLVTDAEVYQEILHRYVAIRRPDAIDEAWQVLTTVVDETYVVELTDVRSARRLLEETPGLSARDALHVAIMRRHDVRQILSFDTHFDHVSGIARLG